MNTPPNMFSVRSKIARGGALFASDEVQLLLDALMAAGRENKRLLKALERIAACNGATSNFTRYREVTHIARAALRPSEDTRDES